MTESLRLIKFNKEPEKPKKENEDLQLEFKETEEEKSPTDSKKFIHYENQTEFLRKQKEDMERLEEEKRKVKLVKEAEEVFSKSSTSASKENFIKKYIKDMTEGFTLKE